MVIVDTNIILRYLLKDNEELYSKATKIIDNNKVYIPTEVIVEVCYVLKKVYNVSKEEIYDAVKQLVEYENVYFQNDETICFAFEIYSKKNFDIVDCLLYAYNKQENNMIYTFDKKLNNLLNKTDE